VISKAEMLEAHQPWTSTTEGLNVSCAVVAMMPGTKEEAVWQICQTGFAAASIVDDGWYGKGRQAFRP